jgi:hypothetical protein
MKGRNTLFFWEKKSVTKRKEKRGYIALHFFSFDTTFSVSNQGNVAACLRAANFR